VVADLLTNDGAAVQPTLVSLTQDGVKGFLHLQVQQRITNAEYYCVFEALKGAVLFGCFLIEKRSKSEAFCS
jgi:hypothetical protein